jgi:hypothetical protein
VFSNACLLRAKCCDLHQTGDASGLRDVIHTLTRDKVNQRMLSYVAIAARTQHVATAYCIAAAQGIQANNFQHVRLYNIGATRLEHRVGQREVQLPCANVLHHAFNLAYKASRSPRTHAKLACA